MRMIMKQYNIITDVLGLCESRSYKELDGEKRIINLGAVYTILEWLSFFSLHLFTWYWDVPVQVISRMWVRLNHLKDVVTYWPRRNWTRAWSCRVESGSDLLGRVESRPKSRSASGGRSRDSKHWICRAQSGSLRVPYFQPRPQGAFPWLWRWGPPPKPGKSALGTRVTYF